LRDEPPPFLCANYSVSFLDRRRDAFFGDSAFSPATGSLFSSATSAVGAAAFFLGVALARPFVFVFVFVSACSLSAVSRPMPPTAMISSAVRCARPPRCTRTRFFDLYRMLSSLDHLGVDIEPVHGRSADFDLFAVAEKQHGAELHRGTRLRNEAIDKNAVARRDAVLLAAADDDSRQRTIRLGHSR